MFRDDLEEVHAYCPHGRNEAVEYCPICIADGGALVLPHDIAPDVEVARCEHGHEAATCGHCWERYADA